MSEFEMKGQEICASLRRCYFTQGIEQTVVTISQYLSLTPISMRDNVKIHELLFDVFEFNSFQKMEEIRTNRSIRTMDKIRVLKYIASIYRDEEFWYEMIIKSPILAKMYKTDDPMFNETLTLVN